jgi:hypothetical protein
MKGIGYTLIILGIITSSQISCGNKNGNHPEIIIERFSKESYYEKTKEAKFELYHAIDSSVTNNDRFVICSLLNTYSIDNLSADVVIEIRNQRADSIHLNGLLTFDMMKNPAKINDSTILRAVSKALLVSTSYPEKDGLYGMRIQLERICH